MASESIQSSARTAVFVAHAFAGMTLGLVVLGHGSKLVMASVDGAGTTPLLLLVALSVPAIFSVLALFALARLFTAFAKGATFARGFGSTLAKACAWATVATALQIGIDWMPADWTAQIAQYRMTFDPTKITLLAFIICAAFAGQLFDKAADLKEENDAMV